MTKQQYQLRNDVEIEIDPPDDDGLIWYRLNKDGYYQLFLKEAFDCYFKPVDVAVGLVEENPE